MSLIWDPIENDCEQLERLAISLGFNEEKFKFQEIYSLDSDFLSQFDKITIGIILLFPESQEQEMLKCQAKNQNEQNIDINQNHKFFFMKQYEGNACATISIFHCLLNLNQQHYSIIKKNSILERFYNDSQQFTQETIGQNFHNNKEINDLHTIFTNSTLFQDNDNNTPVNHHYSAFCSIKNQIFEFDGMRVQPVFRCFCKEGEILSSFVKDFVLNQTTDRLFNPDEQYDFSIIAILMK